MQIEHPLKNRTNRRPISPEEHLEGQKICKSILQDLVGSFFKSIHSFDNSGYVPQFNQLLLNRNTPRESSNLLEHAAAIPLIAKYQVGLARDNNILLKRIPSHSPRIHSDPNHIVLNHIKIADQHIYNLCGYHLNHSMVKLALIFKLGCLETPKNLGLKGEIDKIIEKHVSSLNDPVSFWLFHFNITKFLWRFALQMRKDTSKYPWKLKDCIYGDYERIYHQVLNEHHPLYKQVFSAEQNGYAIEVCSLELQFGRYITGFARVKEIQDTIDDFINTPQKKGLFLMKLGVTNHWVGFVVYRLDGQLSFFYLDSRNEDCLDWNEESLKAFLERKRLTRLRQGLPWINFVEESMQKSIEDVHIVTRILPMVFMGQMSLFDHTFKVYFMRTYARYWRKEILLPMCRMVGNEEGKIYNHIMKYFGDLKTFIHEFYCYFNLFEYLSQEHEKQILAVFLECRGVLGRSLKQIKHIRYGKSQVLIAKWEAIVKVSKKKSVVKRMKQLNLYNMVD